MDQFLSWVESHHAIVGQVFLVVFASLVANYLIQRSLKALSGHLRKTNNPWDDALTDALRLR